MNKRTPYCITCNLPCEVQNLTRVEEIPRLVPTIDAVRHVPYKRSRCCESEIVWKIDSKESPDA